MQERVDDPAHSGGTGCEDEFLMVIRKRERGAGEQNSSGECRGPCSGLRTSRWTIALGVESWRGGVAGQRMMERAGLRAALALAAGHLALRFIGQRQQGEHRGGPKQQDQRETDSPAEHLFRSIHSF